MGKKWGLNSSSLSPLGWHLLLYLCADVAISYIVQYIFFLPISALFSFKFSSRQTSELGVHKKAKQPCCYISRSEGFLLSSFDTSIFSVNINECSSLHFDLVDR